MELKKDVVDMQACPPRSDLVDSYRRQEGFDERAKRVADIDLSLHPLGEKRLRKYSGLKSAGVSGQTGLFYGSGLLMWVWVKMEKPRSAWIGIVALRPVSLGLNPSAHINKSSD